MESSTLSEEVKGSTQPSETENKTSTRNVRGTMKTSMQIQVKKDEESIKATCIINNSISYLKITFIWNKTVVIYWWVTISMNCFRYLVHNVS